MFVSEKRLAKYDAGREIWLLVEMNVVMRWTKVLRDESACYMRRAVISGNTEFVGTVLAEQFKCPSVRIDRFEQRTYRHKSDWDLFSIYRGIL